MLTLIASLFSASHADASLSSDVVRSTLGALLDAQPKLPSREHQLDDKQEKILAGWLESAGEGLVALARVNAQEALPRARALFIELTPVLAHARLPATRQSAEQALRLMVRHCISDDAIKSCVKSRKVQKGSEVATIVRALTDAMHEPVYAGAALAHLLNLAASIFQRLQLRVTSVDGAYDTLRPAATHHSLLAALLRRAADLRESEWRANADAVTKAAVAICGPQWVLDILPLGLGPEGPPHGETNARAWLLPLLRDSVHNTQLAHFKLEFVPLLGHFNARREQALSAPTQTEAVKVEGRVYQTLLAQVWELLPAYCQFATDVAAQFDTAFVQQLAGVIYEPPEPAIRSAAVKALHNVVESNARICDSLAPRDVLVDQFGFAQDEAREARQELKSLATAVLGIGFNVYGTLVRGQGQHVLDAMGAWLELLDPAQRAQTLERVMLLLSDTLAKNPEPQGEQNSKSIPQSHALFDILVMSTAHLGPDPLLPRKMLTDMCLADAVLKSRDQGVQKKSYRMMTRLVEHTRGAVVASDVGDVIERLCDDKVIVGNAAKRDRLALLLELVPLLPRDRLHHVPTIIPEAVLGTKEANEKTRECAFDLLVAIGVKMQQGGSVERAKIKWMQKDPADAADDDAEMEEDEEQPAIAEATVEEYLTMIAAGLSGKNAHMISASITALSRLLFEFHGASLACLPQCALALTDGTVDIAETLTDEALEALVETLFGFLESPNREIARSAVSFVKVAIVTLSDSVIHPTLPTLVPNLLRWSREHANHFKIKVRHIVERLIRRFGFDDVEREVPETDKKLVQNIRKRQMRSKRKKAAAAATREDEEAEAEAKEVRACSPDQRPNSAADLAYPVASQDLPKSQAGPRSAFDEVLYGSESESDSDDDEDSEDDERARGRSKHRAGGASRAGKSRGRGKDETRGDERYLYEDEGEVLDLLDDKQMSRISAARPSGKGERKALDSRFKKDKEGRYKFTEDKGEPAVEHPATSSSAFVDAFTNKDGHRLDAKGRARFNKTQGKRGRGDDDDDDDDDVVNDLSELNVGGGKRKKQRTARAEPQRLGAEFKAKRAGGDVKKAGGPAPYAYLPLANVPSSSKKRRGPPPAKVAITGHKRSGKKA